jgi:hypothetical protein
LLKLALTHHLRQQTPALNVALLRRALSQPGTDAAAAHSSRSSAVRAAHNTAHTGCLCSSDGARAGTASAKQRTCRTSA